MSEQLQQREDNGAREGRQDRQWYDYDARKHLVWGVALIAVGCIFLLDRLDIIEVDVFALWHLWPAVIALYGLADIVFAKKMSHVVKGVYHIALAFWLYACLEHLWGWTFGSTWPIILIAYGASLLLRGASKLSNDTNKESHK
ncbi:LiaF transmembrane domain-containing protein [Undibacterium sp.]|jgi:hypothetical protein|uniref:LiaF transmembrane domain-containing protein n=1 Tax=Undibacterium sp. TaxID=1914977 RepID=UPI002B6D1F0E|nr:DUF5668 domain-containing protein [Undibacterium sp.]HTD06797.1 DUF5668 domain-containing protein [Undibacterium sp.]